MRRSTFCEEEPIVPLHEKLKLQAVHAVYEFEYNEFNGDMAQQQLHHLAKVALSWVKVPLSPKFRKKIPVGRREFTLMET